MLTRYGTDNIIIMLIIGALFLVGSFYFDSKWLTYPLGFAGVLLIVFTLWFFRDPIRMTPEKALKDESYIVAPADGKIVEIVDEVEKYYIKDDSKRISIFLSPLDVHVNRLPATGKIEFYEYFKGDYLVAFHPKSSELNEHSRIGMMTKYGKVYFKQIVGILARRLVCEIQVGDLVKVGDQFGMMKFGSRMDVAFDPGTEIFVKVGDKVVGGETIIARLEKSNKIKKSSE